MSRYLPPGAWGDPHVHGHPDEDAPCTCSQHLDIADLQAENARLRDLLAQAEAWQADGTNPLGPACDAGIKMGAVGALTAELAELAALLEVGI